jgi:hypothetical protein
MESGRPLTAEDCHEKAMEARELSKRAETPAHQTMLLHIAETWENVCADLKATQAQ